MKSGPLKLGGLPIILLVACGTGAESPPPDGATTTGTAGTTGSAGATGTAGTTGGAGTTGTAGTTGSAGTTGTAGTTGAGGTGGGAAALSFAADIWPVFDQTRNPFFVYRGMGSYAGCSTGGVCHGGTNPGARLSMRDVDTAYRALVNVASTTTLCAGAVRVIPGDPARSCLILFYKGRLMDDLMWVNQAEIDLVSRWIAEGARP